MHERERAAEDGVHKEGDLPVLVTTTFVTCSDFTKNATQRNATC
jgi:hypothetical protein